jgi:hypothetical protein
MSSPARPGSLARRRWRVVLLAGVLGAVSAAPCAALASAPSARATGSVRRAVTGTPTQVIDAQTDPQQAGEALNAGCATLANCQWAADTPITTGYGPQRILGDVTYNCSDPSNEQAYDETAVGVSDEREESTSISETLSVEVGLGFLGFEKATAEFEAFSKQSNSFSTKVTTTNEVSVPPGWKGWTTTEVLSAFVTGSAYVTEGINGLVQVKDIDLSFPGYQALSDTNDTPVKYIGTRTPMTAQDIAAHCDVVNGVGALPPGASGKLGAPHGVKIITKPVGGRFKLALCRIVPVAGLGSVTGRETRRLAVRRCATRTVTGAEPRGIRHATATLTRGRRTYAAGTVTRGRIQLTVGQPIRAGKYALTVSERPAPSGRNRHRPLTALHTVVPITIR